MIYGLIILISFIICFMAGACVMTWIYMRTEESGQSRSPLRSRKPKEKGKAEKAAAKAKAEEPEDESSDIREKERLIMERIKKMPSKEYSVTDIQNDLDGVVNPAEIISMRRKNETRSYNYLNQYLNREHFEQQAREADQNLRDLARTSDEAFMMNTMAMQNMMLQQQAEQGMQNPPQDLF